MLKLPFRHVLSFSHRIFHRQKLFFSFPSLLYFIFFIIYRYALFFNRREYIISTWATTDEIWVRRLRNKQLHSSARVFDIFIHLGYYFRSAKIYVLQIIDLRENGEVNEKRTPYRECEQTARFSNQRKVVMFCWRQH